MTSPANEVEKVAKVEKVEMNPTSSLSSRAPVKRSSKEVHLRHPHHLHHPQALACESTALRAFRTHVRYANIHAKGSA